MKHYFTTTIALSILLAATTSQAVEVTGTVGAVSDNLYRGVSTTNDKPAVIGTLVFSDVIWDGVNVNLQGATKDLGHLNNDSGMFNKMGVSYMRELGVVKTTVGLDRVSNFYPQSFNELYLKGEYELNEDFTLLGSFTQSLSDTVGEDRYATLGVSHNSKMLPELTVGVSASLWDHNKLKRNEFNNLQLDVEYQVLPKVSVFGSYSWSGKSVEKGLDVFDWTFNHSLFKSQGLLGVKYSF